MHWELKKVSGSLSCTNILATDILLDLIHIHPNLDGGMVTTLVDVLVDVFDCTDGAAHLDVDVSLISSDEIAVENHPLIANLNGLVLLCRVGSGELGPR